MGTTMPNFDTPEPISVTLESASATCGSPRATAPTPSSRSARATKPTSPTCKAAEQVRVDFSGGTLQITGPKARVFDFSRKTGRSTCPSNCPAVPRCPLTMQVGDLASAGRLGECRFKTAAGNVRARTNRPAAPGHIGRPHHRRRHHAAMPRSPPAPGRSQIGEVEGSAVVKNSNGDTTIDAVTGDVRVRSRQRRHRRRAGRRRASTRRRPTAASASARWPAARSTLETATGDLEIGIAEGTAAMAGGEHRIRTDAQPAGYRHPARRDRRDRRGARPHLLTATSPSAVPDPLLTLRKEKP